MALVDTHCHLDFNAFDRDRMVVLQRAQEAGLERIVNPAIDIDNCQAVLQLSDAHSEIYAAVGVHPNSALTWNHQTLTTLRSLAQHPKVIAIGEIGLDFFHDYAPRDVQVRIFREQLSVASEYKLPVIVHSRQAETETIDILSEWVTQQVDSSSPPGVMHSYGGDEETAQRAIALGFYIGITGPVTFRNAIQLQHLVTILPLTNLLVETDAPFLAPQPHRGERNEPAYVCLVAEKIAGLKNQPYSRITDSTTANAERLFHWRTV